MGSPARRRMVPSTRDWRLIRGEREGDSTYASTVLFLLLLKHGTCPVLPGLGSKLHLIDKITVDAPLRAQKEVERCLRPLTDRRKIGNLTVVATIVNEYLSIDVTWLDSMGKRGQQKFTLTFGT